LFNIYDNFSDKLRIIVGDTLYWKYPGRMGMDQFRLYNKISNNPFRALKFSRLDRFRAINSSIHIGGIKGPPKTLEIGEFQVPKIQTNKKI
jgi:hypothetical protein